MKQIIFYAPLGTHTPPDKIGGAETGCLKTKQIYESAGIEVLPIEKPARSNGLLNFLLGMLLVPIKLFFMLKTHPYAVLHIVGFYTKQAKYERMLLNVGKKTGHKVIYELRNGSMIESYEKGTNVYRLTLKDLLLKPDIVLCQGWEYVEFIRKKWNVERSYYPNYIMDDFIKTNNLNRERPPVKLIYFGRVTKSKNIDIIIRVLALIRREGIFATLEIIGGYDKIYKSYLDDVINNEKVSECVKFFGRQPFSFIADKLRNAHYFVFPSNEKQEGHSNSLTEAMGCGVVPIVSKAGFNESICGDEDLIVQDYNPKSYADKIIAIEKNMSWSKYSQEVYERVIKNYTQSVVGKDLIEEVNKLFV